MTDYYVNPDAGGAGSGTAADPWSSYESLPTLGSGDQVFARRGASYSGSVTVNGSGGAGSPIVFQPYGPESDPAPVVNAGGVADASCFYGSGKDNWRLTGFQLVGATDFPGAGVRPVDCSGVEIDNCDMPGNWYGVRAEVTGSSPMTGLHIHDNSITDTDDSWILVVGSETSGGTYTDIRVQGNTLRRSGKSGVSIQSREPSATVTSPYAVFDVVVEDNDMDSTGAYGAFLKGIFSSTGAYGKNRVRNNVVRETGLGGLLDTHCIWLGGCQWFDADYNEIDGTWSYSGNTIGSGVGVYVDIFSSSFGSSNVRVRRNTMRNCGRGGTLSAAGGTGVYVLRSADVMVEANLIISCRNGIAVQGGSSTPDAIRTYVRNNTIINCDGSGSAGAGILALAQAKITQVFNNIVIGGKLGMYRQTSSGAVTTFTSGSNVWYGQSVRAIGDGNGTTTSPGSGTSPDATDLLTDPLVSAAGLLLPGSPALRTGNVVSALSRDRWGHQRRKLPSRGAHEPATLRRAIAA